MSLGIGIDTGGTYTDAVIYDFETRSVLAKGKAPTTKENLSIGIGQALDALPRELFGGVGLVALSTTLATNACVENKGGRAKLILMGTSDGVLEWLDSKKSYGLNREDILCLDTRCSFDGQVIDEPDWAQILAEHGPWLADASALSVAEFAALRNGAVCEKNARTILEEKLGLPVVTAHELAAGLNLMERGATAQLNARLLPVIAEFMAAVEQAMAERGLDVKAMVVRSDGSLMVDRLSQIRPVETILSGPASSVLGGRGLVDSPDCLIVDMGGTTTDISIVEENLPAMTSSIRIGGWKTQIKGVLIHTFGLGGDSRVLVCEGKVSLDERRVMPLCAAASRWPEIKGQLEALLKRGRTHHQPLYEFLYLLREPAGTGRYTPSELDLIGELRKGPVMLGGNRVDVYNLTCERLETEGVVMRCGLTPTDIMHLRGDFSRFDTEASRLAVRYLLSIHPRYEDDERSLEAFCEEVYDKVCQKLYENIVRIHLGHRYPNLLESGMGEQLDFLISESWTQRHDRKKAPFFAYDFRSAAPLVGIGAPTHIFLPRVAEALGTECLIPEHAEVANAVGAIIADVSARAEVKVQPVWGTFGISDYTVYSELGNESYKTLEEALAAAEKSAIDAASQEARRRGALGELSVKTTVEKQVGYARVGYAKIGENHEGAVSIDLGTRVTATVSGRIEL